MKKHTLLVFVLIFAVILTGCQKKNENAAEPSTESSAANERYPSFAVESVEVSSGDKDVIVHVSVKDNPGFLTMAMNITYDSSKMSLTKAVSGPDYSDYNFVGPKNKQSGCTASWFVPEMPEESVDGVILDLYFDIEKQAESGSYPVSVSRPNDGGVVDQNKEEIIFNNATGYVKVK